ncbi:MAG: hypothetical protein GXO66_05010 [Euryarchaeota archaeon]|nr:hypothetical protein [Euryarchaeota archaeon]
MGDRNLALVAVAGLLLLFLFPAFGMGGMMGFGMGLGLLFWVAVALLLYHLLTGREEGSDAALKLLKERYARGEITREEYLRMKEELGG